MNEESTNSPIAPPGGHLEMRELGDDQIPDMKPDSSLDNVFANEARGGISTASGIRQGKKLEARKKGSNVKNSI